MTSLECLSDNKLLSRLETLVRREQATTLDVVLHLGEVERRRLYLRLAYSSMFEYTMKHLGYSSSAAGRRLQIARAARRYPELVLMLRRDEVNLTTAGLVAPVLSGENGKTLLEQVRNKTQREVERVVAAWRPAADVPDRVRMIQVPAPVPQVPPAAVAIGTRQCLRMRMRH